MAEQRFCLVATAKNEGPYILEWVAWHRMIGFTDILMFQNDSDDGTHFILKELDRLGLIVYHYNEAPRGAHQVRAYKRAALHPAYRAADWAMALDLDEFLTFNGPAQTVTDWLDLLPEADRVLVNWKLFGNHGHIMPPDGLVSENFIAADNPNKIAHFREPFKTFFRRDAFWRPGVHKPVSHAEGAPERIVTVNASGLPERDINLRNFQSSDPAKRCYAQINHYVVRDAGSFLLKSTRGSAHQDQRNITQTFWDKRNRNHARDTTLAERAHEIRAVMRAYDDMSGGKLMRLRREALLRHRQRIMALMADDACRALYYHCAGIDPAREIEAQRPFQEAAQ